MKASTIVLMGLVGGVLVGCAPRRHTPVAPVVAAPPPPVVQAPLPPTVDAAFVEALAQYRKTRKAPIVQKDGVTLYPYADGLTLRCQAMRLCDVEFGEGEEIRRVIIGNPEEWLGQKSVSGEGQTRREHLALSPNEKKVNTQVIVYTSKRTYSLEVVEGSPSMARVGFWFPEEVQQQVTARDVALAKRSVEQGQKNERYEVSGNASWRPVKVYDDGTRVFILFPEDVRTFKMPVVYVSYQGKDELVNHSVQWPYLIVAQLFDRAALVIGVGRQQERVTIRRVR